MTDQGAVGLVNDKFTDSKEYAEAAFAQANTLLAALANTTFSVNFPQVDTDIPVVTYTPNLGTFNYVPAEIVEPDAEVNDITLQEIPEYSGEVPEYIRPEVSSTVIDPVPGTLEEIPGIEKPTMPTFHGSLTFADFDATSVIDQSVSILNNLQMNIESVGVVILEFITNPQQAIGDDIVTEMTLAMLQKVDDDFAAKYTEVNTYFSSRGWNMPQGVMVGRMTELDRAHSVQRSSVQRDVLIKNFELSQQNFITALQTYIQYVQANNAAVANTLNTLFGALKYMYESVAIKLQAYVSLFQAEIEAYKTDTSVQIQIAVAMIEKNKATVEMYSAEVQALSAKIGAISAYNNDLTKQLEAGVSVYGATIQGIAASNSDMTKKYAADIQKYTAETQSAIGQSEIAIKNASNLLAAYDTEAKYEVARAQVAVSGSTIRVDAKKAEVQLTIEKIEADIKNMIALSGLTAEIAKAAATIAAQLAASSMSAVSAGAQISYHTNANYDETKDIVETRINLSGAV